MMEQLSEKKTEEFDVSGTEESAAGPGVKRRAAPSAMLPRGQETGGDEVGPIELSGHSMMSPTSGALSPTEPRKYSMIPRRRSTSRVRRPVGRHCMIYDKI